MDDNKPKSVPYFSEPTANRHDLRKSQSIEILEKEIIPPTLIKCSFPTYDNNSVDNLELPEELVSNPDVFYEILSKKTWDNHLNDSQRTRLLGLLPENVSTNKETKDDFLTKFFDAPPKSNSFFSHPLVDFQQKLAGGYYDSACANEIRQLKACSRLHYEHRIRECYGRVLKKVLIYRRKLLESAASVPEGEPFSYDWKTDFLDGLHRQRNHGYGCGDDGSYSPAWRRALKRARLMTNDCKLRVGESQALSSDDDESIGPPAAKSGLNGQHGGSTGTSWQSSGHKSHGGQSTTVFDGGHSSNSAVRSTLANPNRLDLDLHEPFGTCEIKDMLKEYRRLRRSHPEHPSLEFDDIELDDVVDRCGSEIRTMAQKWGVYTRQSPPGTNVDSMQSSASAALSFLSANAAAKKPTASKSHSVGKTTSTTSKEKEK